MLWALVGVRLICPFSIESPASLVPQTNFIMQGVVDTNLIHPENVPLNPTGMITTGETGGLSVAQSLPVLPVIWCIGVFLMLCYFAFSYLKMRRLVREAVPEQGNVWICDAVATPSSWEFSGPESICPPAFPRQIGRMCWHMSAATCAARITGGSLWPSCSWPSIGSTLLCGRPTPWCAGTLNSPVTSG